MDMLAEHLSTHEVSVMLSYTDTVAAAQVTHPPIHPVLSTEVPTYCNITVPSAATNFKSKEAEAFVYRGGKHT